MQKLRAFIALEMPEEIRHALAEISSRLKRELFGIPLRWVPVENMHLTLKFLGDILPGKVSEISGTLEEITAHQSPIQIQINDIGAFPNINRTRVVWVGLNYPEPLHQLQNQIESQLEKLDFPWEGRSFSPHLTLARVRDHAQHASLRKIAEVLTSSKKPQPVEAQAHKITLFCSKLKPSGSVYNALSQFVLSRKD